MSGSNTHVMIVELFQIGHVNKSGEVAGPRVLEHIVDVVLYMEVGTCTPLTFYFCYLFFSHVTQSYYRQLHQNLNLGLNSY